MKFSICHLIVASIFTLQFQLGSCLDEDGDTLIPRQLYCLSEIVYRRQELKLENYVVDEYVDIPNDRSSVRLIDSEKSTTNIYYHQINPPERPTKRKFIVYDPDQETCQFYQPRDWPLNKIRKTVVQMLPMSKLSRELCDLILGPSALLYAVEASRENYQFIRRDFNEQRLLSVDLYERVVDKDPDLVIRGKILVVQVQVIAQYNAEADKLAGKSLATSYGDARPEFVSIKISSVPTKRLRRWGEACLEDELMLNVQYHIITSMLTGSLVGRELDETDGFDFNRDPFMQSVGIGCWKDVSYMGQSRFNAPKDQFSGLYVTTLGSSGVSYVAWDGRRNLLRLDRDGRKSIYDLSAKKSYHHGEFVSLEQFHENSNKRGKEKSCVVLNLEEEDENKSSSAKIRANMDLEQLIGLGLGNRANAIHLGSKMVDHVNYEVYELELFDSFPILMATEGFTEFETVDTRYFMTYYVEEHKVERQGDSLTKAIILPKFIELHELHKDLAKVKFLINRLEFLQFSWSLEVEPSDDTDNLKNLFYIEECAQPRSSQVELRFGLIQDPKSTKVLPKRMELTFRRQKQLIRQTVQSRIADMIDLSDLNVAHLNVKFVNQQSVDMLVEAKLVELIDGLVEDTLLGYAYFFDIEPTWQKSFISSKFNRHSLDECKLDSLMEESKNTLMYCPSTTACILVQPEAVQSRSSDLWQKVPPAKDSKEQNKIKCELHNFKWAPSSDRKADEVNLYERIRRNLISLYNRQFRIEFEHRETAQAAPEFAMFVGLSQEPRLISMDELSLLGGSVEDALLNGIRHSVMESVYTNLAIDMRRQADVSTNFDPLRYCQQACQMDSHCQSFSICLRPRKEPLQAADCVLSTLRLTPRMVTNLAEKLREFRNKTEAKFELSIGAERFSLHRQSECSLHPKDFFSVYKLIKKVQLRPKYLGAESKGTSLLSLGECAAKSHDESLLVTERLSNFTYCPLSMSCLPDSLGSVVGDNLNQEQPCQVYQRTFGQFFRSQPHSHLAIDLAGSQEPPNTMLHLNKQAKNDLTLALMGHVDQEKCAQLCLIRKAQCLAFDLCKMISGENGCFQYAIRSPAGGKINRRLGLLPKELEFYSSDDNIIARQNGVVTKQPTGLSLATSGGNVAKEENNNDKDSSQSQSQSQSRSQARSKAKIVANNYCSHHSLWPTYADIRVAQLLGAKQQQQPADEIERPTEDGADEIERQILEDGANEISDLASTKVNDDDRNSSDADKANQHHWSLFLLGFALTSVGVICSQQVTSCTGDLWSHYRARQATRNMGPRISQLALANVDDLDRLRQQH